MARQPPDAHLDVSKLGGSDAERTSDSRSLLEESKPGKDAAGAKNPAPPDCLPTPAPLLRRPRVIQTSEGDAASGAV